MPPGVWGQELQFEDYREGVGEVVDGVLQVRMVAQEVDWQPRGDGTPILKAYAFSVGDGPPRMPGPMIRVQAGTPVEVSVTNELDRTVVLRGLTDRTPTPDDPASGESDQGGPLPPEGLRDEGLRLEPGESGSVRFTPSTPGSFIYYARTEPVYGPLPLALPGGDGPDGPFMGPLIVDSIGSAPEPNEQVMLITRWGDLENDPTSWSQSWKMMINGRAWPATQRLEYEVGDTVTWRVINASLQSHPMHLHGFYYEVHARGDQASDTTFAEADRRLAVTEWVAGTGATMRVRWVAETAGNWLFHCHLVRHMSSVQRLTGEAEPSHDGVMENHALEGMAGMVMGIAVRPRAGQEAHVEEPVERRIQLYTSRRDSVFDGEPGYSFVVAEGGVPALDSLRTPGSPLLLTRDEMTEIVVHNRLEFPFGVHWHGLELESRYDGVADWSGDPGQAVPAIPPGDSLVVRIDPPRAGTFIYHVHSEPGHQLAQGMYGPFIVLEPDEPYDPEHDRTFLLASQGTDPDEQAPVVNGDVEPPPVEMQVGQSYRLRFINMSTDDLKSVRLLSDGTPEEWRFVAKDGADLPPSQVIDGPAELPRIGVGETFDFVWTPSLAGTRTLEITTSFYGARSDPPDVRAIPVVVR
jgi:FtsP/CotA-like multicopper oxidase with cupredoxin domain